MAAKDNKTVDQGGKVLTGEALFDEIVKGTKGAQEVFLDRPIVDWDELGDQKAPVVGFCARIDHLNLPPGTKRDGGKTTWEAYLFQLTRPTKAKVGNDIVEVEAGRQVYVARNPKSRELDKFLGQENMHEIAIIATHKIETANRPMWTFRVAELGRTMKREGQFIAGGPNAQSLPQGFDMPGDASPGERQAARNEVPFS